MRRGQSAMAGDEDGKMATSQESGQPPEADKHSNQLYNF